MRRSRDRREWWRSRWWLPSLSLALGAVTFGAFAVGGNPSDGVKSLGVMAAVAALFWWGGRSETLRGLGGPGRDERWAMIDLRATAAAGLITITAVLGAWLYEIADGQDGSPYAQVAAVAGVSYIVAVTVLRRRS